MSNIFLAIKFIMKLIDVFQEIGKLVKEKKLDEWITELQKTTEDGKRAETPEQKQQVAKDMVRLIGGLGN